MYREVNLSDAFENVESITELLEKLEEYKSNNILYLKSYGFGGITTQNLIEKVNALKQDIFYIDDMVSAILYYIHS